MNNKKVQGKFLEDQYYISFVKENKKGLSIILNERKSYNKLQMINEHELSLEDLLASFN